MRRVLPQPVGFERALEQGLPILARPPLFGAGPASHHTPDPSRPDAGNPSKSAAEEVSALEERDVFIAKESVDPQYRRHLPAGLSTKGQEQLLDHRDDLMAGRRPRDEDPLQDFFWNHPAGSSCDTMTDTVDSR